MDDIRYSGGRKADIRFMDGALPHAVGVKSYQVMRACRNLIGESDGIGWTYNHAPMLAFWKGKFFLEYLSNPVSEHEAPGQVLICSSDDGENWSFPKVIFPRCEFATAPFRGPKKELFAGRFAQAVAHHRMAFYVAKNGVLLATTFLGICPEIHVNPNNGYGIGRVVRRVREDMTFSPVYFIKYNEAGGYTEENNGGIFGYYKHSKDGDFVAACDELLANKLVIQQWWEEERFDESFVAGGASALSYYTAADGKLVGVYKQGLTRLSSDGGESWSEPARNPSIETATGKVWGQKTGDGKYALMYNPTTDGQHRWPIAIVTGDDGYSFGDMLAVTAEVAPQRYAGEMKNLGPQYLRGICESNPQPDDGDIWLTYSNNKEDIWVSKIPVPVMGGVTGDVDDKLPEDFDKWNVYSPKWAPVTRGDGCLRLCDHDRYDRAIAERAVPKSRAFEMKAVLRADVLSEKTMLLVEVCDEKAAAAIEVLFGADGFVHVKNGGRAVNDCAFDVGRWYAVSLKGDCYLNDFAVTITDQETGAEILAKRCRFSQSVRAVERVSFATKRRFNLRGLDSNGHDGKIGDLENPDVATPKGEYRIASLSFVKTE